MKFAFAIFTFSITALAQTVIGPAQTGGRLQDSHLERISVYSGTEDVLRELSRIMGGRAVFGVESLGGLEPHVSVSDSEARFDTIVQEICRQDSRYKAVYGEDPRLINFVAAAPKSAGEKILHFRLSHLDITTDDWPLNIVPRLPEFSPELQRYLAVQYRAAGGLDRVTGSAGIGMNTNVKPPHFELHLANVTVREALNAIAVHSLDVSLATGTDPRSISTPAEKRIFPTGWLLRVRDPGTLTLDAWVRTIFSAL